MKKITIVDNYFLYIVLSDHYSNVVNKIIKEKSIEHGLNLSVQGSKIYLIPPCLSKAKAIDEYCRLTSFEGTRLATGDSVLDFPMATVVDTFIRPVHGDSFNLNVSNVEDTEYPGAKSFLTTLDLYNNK